MASNQESDERIVSVEIHEKDVRGWLEEINNRITSLPKKMPKAKLDTTIDVMINEAVKTKIDDEFVGFFDRVYKINNDNNLNELVKKKKIEEERLKLILEISKTIAVLAFINEQAKVSLRKLKEGRINEIILDFNLNERMLKRVYQQMGEFSYILGDKLNTIPEFNNFEKVSDSIAIQACRLFSRSIKTISKEAVVIGSGIELGALAYGAGTILGFGTAGITLFWPIVITGASVALISAAGLHLYDKYKESKRIRKLGGLSNITGFSFKKGQYLGREEQPDAAPLTTQDTENPETKLK